MRCLTVRHGLVAGALLSVLAGAASVPAEERALTLPEAEALAMEYNPQLTVAEDSLVRAKTRITQSRAGLLPSLSAAGSYTRNVEKSAMYIADADQTLEFGSDNDYAFGFTGSQPIFLGFAGITGYRMAQTGVKSVEAQVSQTKQNVIESVRIAYMTAVLNRRLVEVQKEAVAQAESSLTQTQRQYDVGSASRFDLIRAQVQLSTARPGLTTALSNRELADAQLRTAIGVDPGTYIAPKDTLALFHSPWQETSMDSLLSVAYRNRPDLQQFDHVHTLASYGVDIAKSGYYPTLAAFGNTQWQQLAPSKWHRSTAVGLQLQWSLWESGRRMAEVQEARVGVRQVESIQKLVRQGIALQVESSQRTLQEAWTNLQSLRETVDQASEALRLARVLYEAGGSTQLDVIGSQLSLTQAQTQYASALYQYHVANIQMEKALGLIETGRQGA